MIIIRWNKRLVLVVGIVLCAIFAVLLLSVGQRGQKGKIRSLQVKNVGHATKLVPSQDKADLRTASVKMKELNESKMPGATYSITKTKIPRIIHQIWDTYFLPRVFDFWVKSCVDTHERWEYWFWTEKDVELFVSKFYPQYFTLYSSYPNMLYRADIARYLIMHHYGGLYLDLDMKCYKSLDDIAEKHECVLSEETYEHTFLLRNGNSTNVFNSILLCRPGASLFKKAMESLPFYKADADAVLATGPLFLDRVERGSEHSPPLTIFPPRFLLSTYDDAEEPRILERCRQKSGLTQRQVALCKDLLRRGIKNTRHADAYTEHKWIHVITYDKGWKRRNTFDIRQLIPKMRVPSRLFSP